ncbi:uncharacterized protein LOC106026258 [Cavia porcellus]|uniref:uncharacterized protein LOC106026258 n=1 Tax=Cavia porcellus TaxID=10141 RepID=UPI002FE153BE
MEILVKTLTAERDELVTEGHSVKTVPNSSVRFGHFPCPGRVPWLPAHEGAKAMWKRGEPGLLPAACTVAAARGARPGLRHLRATDPRVAVQFPAQPPRAPRPGDLQAGARVQRGRAVSSGTSPAGRSAWSPPVLSALCPGLPWGPCGVPGWRLQKGSGAGRRHLETVADSVPHSHVPASPPPGRFPKKTAQPGQLAAGAAVRCPGAGLQLPSGLRSSASPWASSWAGRGARRVRNQSSTQVTPALRHWRQKSQNSTGNPAPLALRDTGRDRGEQILLRMGSPGQAFGFSEVEPLQDPWQTLQGGAPAGWTLTEQHGLQSPGVGDSGQPKGSHPS